MPIRKVRFAIWLEARLNRMVVGLFTPWNCAMGNLLSGSVPTVNVTGPHGFMRTSEGCMVIILGWLIVSTLVAFKKPFGVPSHWPIRKMVVGAGSAETRFRVFVAPA